MMEIFFSAFLIPEVTTKILSQQFDLKCELSRITLYVQGGWLCSLLLDITPPDFKPDALLERTRSQVTAPAHLVL